MRTPKLSVISLLLAALPLNASAQALRPDAGVAPPSTDAGHASAEKNSPLTAEHQTSLFIRYVQSRAGKLPYGFDFLLSDIAKFMNGDNNTFSQPAGEALIPDGRSLQRAKADFTHPREVVSFTQSSIVSAAGAGDIFVAFAPKANQLEVISWNPQTKRYDFFVVENYKKAATPQTMAANTAVCSTCHQHGGPILSRFPWAETSFGNDISARITSARQAELKAALELHKKKLATDKNYRGSEPTLQSVFEMTNPALRRSNLFPLDNTVRDAGRRLQAIQVCRDVCKGNAACLGELFKATLKSGLGGIPQSEWEQINSRFAALAKDSWPKEGLAYPSSIIPDRTPLLKTEQGGSTSFFAAENSAGGFLLSPGSIQTIAIEYQGEEDLDGGIKRPFRSSGTISVRNTAQQTSTSATSFSKDDQTVSEQTAAGISPVYFEVTNGIATADLRTSPNAKEIRLTGTRKGSRSDPATPRPLVNALSLDMAASTLAPHFSACFNINVQSDFEKLRILSTPTLSNALEKVDLATIAKGLWEGTMPVSKASQMIEDAIFHEARTNKIVGKRSKTKASDEEAKKLANQFCGSCHKTNSGAPQLPLNDWSAMKKYKDLEGNSIEYYLDENLMPPDGEAQPSEGERAALSGSLGN